MRYFKPKSTILRYHFDLFYPLDNHILKRLVPLKKNEKKVKKNKKGRSLLPYP